MCENLCPALNALKLNVNKNDIKKVHTRIFIGPPPKVNYKGPIVMVRFK